MEHLLNNTFFYYLIRKVMTKSTSPRCSAWMEGKLLHLYVDTIYDRCHPCVRCLGRSSNNSYNNNKKTPTLGADFIYNSFQFEQQPNLSDGTLGTPCQCTGAREHRNDLRVDHLLSMETHKYFKRCCHQFDQSRPKPSDTLQARKAIYFQLAVGAWT